MKNLYSFIACCVISLVLLQYRISYSNFGSANTLRVTTWDALGYYMYLPSAFIYNDATELKWFPDIDKKYQVSGGWVYQANIYKKTNKYVFKYLGGVAIMEMPFFLAGHCIAKAFHYDADGFSPPYQYSLAFGVLLYCILSLFLLRSIFLRFFSDTATAITLLLVMLATNIIQYVAIDSAQSHAWIFPLYVLILYFTIKWHEKPTLFRACIIGYIIGLASISRPTEAIMLFIPLFWGTQTKESAKAKWALVKQNRNHIYYAILFVFLGVLPQLIYWQMATGFFIYDVGSKWAFLNPFFRVLFGWEKGWFIYTPVTIFFIVGMFYLKPYPFKKSVLWFCLLNIYIIISWFDWRYGGSYSTRALSQSYPVFALPLAAFVEYANSKKWKYLFYIVGLYLIGVNLFQIMQYNKTILHYDDMNRKYYGRIYLNPNPTPLDMSQLDSTDYLSNESKYRMEIVAHADTVHAVQSPQNVPVQVFNMDINPGAADRSIKEEWLKIEAKIKVTKGYQGGYFSSELQEGDSIKRNRVRLFSPISWEGGDNNYAFYINLPNCSVKNTLRLYLYSKNDIDGIVESIKVTSLRK
jgi:hypothetical protein